MTVTKLSIHESNIFIPEATNVFEETLVDPDSKEVVGKQRYDIIMSQRSGKHYAVASHQHKLLEDFLGIADEVMRVRISEAEKRGREASEQLAWPAASEDFDRKVAESIKRLQQRGTLSIATA